MLITRVMTPPNSGGLDPLEAFAAAGEEHYFG
jgi:hypothetical protein